MSELNVDFISLELSIDEDVSVWTCNAVVGDLSQFDSIKLKDTFTVNIQGEVWDFVVVSKQLNRSNPTDSTFTLVGKTPTILLEPPYAAAIDLVLLEDTPAKELVEFLLQTTVIDWSLKDLDNNSLDWILNKFSLAEVKANRVEISRKIVNAAGGVLECTPNGSWIVRHLFPISPTLYDTAVPDHFFTDIDHVLSSSHQYDATTFYDWVRVRNTSHSEPSDSIEIIFDEGSNLSGTLKVYPYPYRDVDLVTTASDAVITLDQASKVEEIRLESDELIEFAKGQASTKYPIYEIVSVVWQDVDLTGVVFDIDTKELYSTNELFSYSLARVTYKTRCLTWRVSSITEYDAQFLVVDNNG